MTDPVQLRTARLSLRTWRDADRAPFAALNADPEVMEHFPATLARDESDVLVDRIVERMNRHGVGLWAVEVRATGEFAGFVGLNPVPRELPIRSEGWEVGWRLARRHWGHGYAGEAARAALAYGLGEAGLAEIVSFTATTNLRSQAVMRRIGMQREPADDFDHPALPPGHPLRRHVLYRARRDQWVAASE